MCHHEHCVVSLPGDLRKQRHHRVAILAVEGSRRFVSKDHRRRTGNRAGDCDTLLLAAAHVPWIAAQLVREADRLQCRLRVGHRLRIAHAANVEREAHILERCQRREQVVGLEDEADVTATDIGQFLGVEVVNDLAFDPHAARGWRQNTAEDREQRGLAAAGWSHQQSQLSGPQRQADALERLHAASALPQLLYDVERLEDDGMTHRLNTMAGSIFVTFMIADMAEMAHMKSVSKKSETASPGVMMIGSAVWVLSTTTVSAMIIPST